MGGYHFLVSALLPNSQRYLCCPCRCERGTLHDQQVLVDLLNWRPCRCGTIRFATVGLFSIRGPMDYDPDRDRDFESAYRLAGEARILADGICDVSAWRTFDNRCHFGRFSLSPRFNGLCSGT